MHFAFREDLIHKFDNSPIFGIETVAAHKMIRNPSEHLYARDAANLRSFLQNFEIKGAFQHLCYRKSRYSSSNDSQVHMTSSTRVELSQQDSTAEVLLIRQEPLIGRVNAVLKLNAMFPSETVQLADIQKFLHGAIRFG